MTDFDAKWLGEPSLKFGDGEAKDPRAGLLQYGPWSPGDGNSSTDIYVGFLGTSQSISAVKSLFKQMETSIPREDDEPERNKPPFPGLGANSPFEASFVMLDRWKFEIPQTDIDLIVDEPTTDASVQMLLDLMEKYIKNLAEDDPPPNVIVISLPPEIVDACTHPDESRPKMKAGDTDFHDRIKTFGLEYDVPTQLIRPSSLRFGKNDDGQEKAEVAWNLAVAMLYKSKEGHPWKLGHLQSDTCYAGISFYKERHGDRSRTHASLAQVFLGTGESFVLRGDPAVKDDGSGNNHLTKDSARDIVKQILEQYKFKRRGAEPSRFVLHKTSRFKPEERQGFKEGAGDVDKLDFVTIREGDPIRLYASGNYPPLRGTVLSPRGENKHFLYTQGYTPAVQTYPGPRIPTPITVEPDPEECHSSYEEICKEILSFTKLDWNTSDFAKKKPVTIKVARAVGAILAEAEKRNIKVKPQYYYYM